MTVHPASQRTGPLSSAKEARATTAVHTVRPQNWFEQIWLGSEANADDAGDEVNDNARSCGGDADEAGDAVRNDDDATLMHADGDEIITGDAMQVDDDEIIDDAAMPMDGDEIITDDGGGTDAGDGELRW